MKSFTRRQALGLVALFGLGACSKKAIANDGERNSGSKAEPGAASSAATTTTKGSGDYMTVQDFEGSTYTSGIHHAKISVAGFGDITVELNATIAPVTVANFASLAESGFYNGLTFHRIMQGFMIQGGDPTGTGRGGSDRNILGEFSSNGVTNTISHVRGTISMARSNMPNSASSQFFICDADDTFLDGNYAAFGHVTEGMEVVDAIAAAAKPVDRNGTIPAADQPVMNSITMID